MKFLPVNYYTKTINSSEKTPDILPIFSIKKKGRKRWEGSWKVVKARRSEGKQMVEKEMKGRKGRLEWGGERVREQVHARK